MNKRKPLQPILTQDNDNTLLTNEPTKQKFTSKTNGISNSNQNKISPHVFLNEDDYNAYWNQCEKLKNLQNALNQTNSINSNIEEELNRLSNVEDKLSDQIALNQQLYDIYIKCRDQES